jgi:hypothetical protein
MLLEHLDRTQWSFKDAHAHVERVVAAYRTAEERRSPTEPAPAYAPWQKPEDPAVRYRREAMEQLLVALRDGDLHAQGRLSTTRKPVFEQSNEPWHLHSGFHEPISPAQWRHGNFNYDKLTSLEWQFIDIRMPRFMVKTIWPEPASETASPMAYTTPYLQLMQEAIASFGLSERCQDKKANIVDWLMRKEVDGEPISQNLADAIATLIRLPASQRGGAKRAF